MRPENMGHVKASDSRKSAPRRIPVPREVVVWWTAAGRRPESPCP